MIRTPSLTANCNGSGTPSADRFQSERVAVEGERAPAGGDRQGDDQQCRSHVNTHLLGVAASMTTPPAATHRSVDRVARTSRDRRGTFDPGPNTGALGGT